MSAIREVKIKHFLNFHNVILFWNWWYYPWVKRKNYVDIMWLLPITKGLVHFLETFSLLLCPFLLHFIKWIFIVSTLYNITSLSIPYYDTNYRNDAIIGRSLITTFGKHRNIKQWSQSKIPQQSQNAPKQLQVTKLLRCYSHTQINSNIG